MARYTKKKKNAADRIVKRAVQLSSRKSKVKVDTGPLVKAEEFSSPVNRFIREHTGMLEEEFFTRVTAKLENLVDKLADDLDKRYKDMPPQNLAYAIGVLVDKVNALKGRPQSVTANVSMGFGPKQRSREEMLAILGGGEVVEVEAERVDDNQVRKVEAEDAQNEQEEEDGAKAER